MILQAKDVSYSYKSKRGTQVLKGVNADFSEGMLYAVLGESGSGKTTFLSLLAGLDVPTSGNILYQDEVLSAKSLHIYRRKYASLVFQNYNLIDYLTAKENVMLGGYHAPVPLLEMVGIAAADQNRNVLKLSGGQQQRVAIARALASDAKILLADEPTGNLDSQTSQEIVDILKSCAHKQNKCVIVVTHSLELADNADVVLQMKDGELLKPVFAS